MTREYQTQELDRVFEAVVKANDKMISSLNKGLSSDYARLQKQLKEILSDAHQSYEVAGKLNWVELQRYKRIQALEDKINKAIKEGYKPIRSKILKEERMILENGYNNNLRALNTIPNVALTQSLTGAQIDAILAKPWSGLTLAERISLRVSDLGVKINGNIKSGVMGEGATYKENIDQLTKTITKEYMNTQKMVENTSYQYLSDVQQTVFEQAKDDGYEIIKTWVSAGDLSVRSAHEALDGQTVRGDEMFEIPKYVVPKGEEDWSGYKADGPGLFSEPALSYNCRCWLVAGVRQKETED